MLRYLVRDAFAIANPPLAVSELRSDIEGMHEVVETRPVRQGSMTCLAAAPRLSFLVPGYRLLATISFAARIACSRVSMRPSSWS